MPGSCVCVYLHSHTHTHTHTHTHAYIYMDCEECIRIRVSSIISIYTQEETEAQWQSGNCPSSHSWHRVHLESEPTSVWLEVPDPPTIGCHTLEKKDLFFLIPNDFSTSCLAPEVRQPVSWVVCIFLGPPAHHRPSFSKFNLQQLIWVVIDHFWILRLLLPGPL